MEKYVLGMESASVINVHAKMVGKNQFVAAAPTLETVLVSYFMD